MDPRDLAVRVLARVPLGVVDTLAWLVAWTWWWVLPVRRTVAVDNLRRSLPEVPVRPTLTRMMHDLVLGFVELVREPPVRVDVDAACVAPGSIILSGHGGAFEIGVLACANTLPTALFIRPPASAWARRRLAEVRASHDVVTLEPGQHLADALPLLEAGRSVIFVQDQHFGKGVARPFFGRPAFTSLGFARAVLETGRPAVAAWPERVGVGHHRLVFRPFPFETTGDRQADLLALTDLANRWYEDRIREAPHGWLWLHRRWKAAGTLSAGAGVETG